MKNLTIKKTFFAAILGLLPLCGCVNETPVPPPQEILVSPQDMIAAMRLCEREAYAAAGNPRVAAGND